MKLLLSNDDGWHAPGLAALHEIMAGIYDEIVCVAPDRDRSGASNSLTLDRPLFVRECGNNTYAVDGTPTDCVHLATTGLFEAVPDMVLAGINAGANLGDDVIYSGTVAAATEGRSLGLPAMAVSLVGERCTHYETAARVALQLVQRLLRLNGQFPEGTILNVNVPDLAFGELSGIKATRLGNRHRAAKPVATDDPRGRRVYWIGPVGGRADAGEGTDFHAIAEGFVSVTPLQIDLTRHVDIASLDDWLGRL